MFNLEQNECKTYELLVQSGILKMGEEIVTADLIKYHSVFVAAQLDAVRQIRKQLRKIDKNSSSLAIFTQKVQ